ncbi:MAG: hypothetical protein H6935_09335 [Thiobacillus sp.]|nr:hypothetical protein [Thiobacillus sp.]
MSNCIKCNAELPKIEGPGRPKGYCSTACRRAAEHEVRRLDRRIDELESRLSYIRTGGFALPGEVDRVSAELQRLERRMLMLMGTEVS